MSKPPEYRWTPEKPRKEPDEARQEAEAHWEFLEKWFHMIFVDAYIHCAKHKKEKK